MKNLLILLSLTVLFTACNSNNKIKQSEVNLSLETTLNKSQKAWVEKTLSELSVREMAGQVVLNT
jgi:predicted component of type VI protein secretion system